MTFAAPLAAAEAAEEADGCHAAQRRTVPAAGSGTRGVWGVTGVLTGVPASKMRLAKVVP